ncbi:MULTISPECIES: phosphate ABC transporter permease subunit PstC [Paracoccus]|jgi:phosphate transport system permease protein|uniref:Phosphate transport system permease protein n=1 Tax=Paracoccus denitrificans (strain Pd 1222) TaxID=318586 RepID=A1BA49_PARDP|nr:MULTISPECIES: phosphate ABC transporter permease subunit PstC [Paracoccus]ABL72393.1 phosphate ABC transporter membrane protein 1, PhoT family [Paracoccus denitrificans PD1222]MBB4628525.1 phosphate transport system permease protein [Paracoccus denitrificans]MCU7430174.1 phosphate ABC transporter permease subunit PstC [Paracoccus denitrificans]MDK8873905.1 phosphate ABC transporter permease subunit PstC [Paracoccus sp. SSJ]QAR28954.1 phosphate ABC transporter permease subunit PstC [Paracocc
MPVSWTLLLVLALAGAGYFVTRARVVALAGGDVRRLHSRPSYHGWNAALLTALPALFLIAIWRFVQPAANATPVAILALVLAAAGLGFALVRSAPGFRARNAVESMVKGLLILCSSIAILTTAGIVFSMLFESGHFFRQYPWHDFFFGTTWSPRFGGGSQLGILPLLWGTLYISLIALAVSVPIGLFAAIYMSEYASPRLRGVAKPMIEVLAGIPTIVYGLFALITVGPMLRDYFAQPLGLGNSGSSVMTAGLVMGIMLIPFVSSLSDDIINAVPQSLRDGALGLGSTQSETVRKVVLPAALPGIVGAVLLAASRAIGETMIVVLGAGAAARMDLNPFEAMTTITVKIVSQLTGDNDFAAPETLVAFALGLTLFVITLGLNIVALYVVRKYREQYE